MCEQFHIFHSFFFRSSITTSHCHIYMQLLLGYLFRCFDHAFAHNAKCRDNFINSFDASIITWNVIPRRGADELSNRAAINSIQLKPIHCTIAHGHVRSRQTRFTFNFRLFFCLRFHSWHLRKKSHWLTQKDEHTNMYFVVISSLNSFDVFRIHHIIIIVVVIISHFSFF